MPRKKPGRRSSSRERAPSGWCDSAPAAEARVLDQWSGLDLPPHVVASIEALRQSAPPAAVAARRLAEPTAPLSGDKRRPPGSPASAALVRAPSLRESPAFTLGALARTFPLLGHRALVDLHDIFLIDAEAGWYRTMDAFADTFEVVGVSRNAMVAHSLSHLPRPSIDEVYRLLDRGEWAAALISAIHDSMNLLASYPGSSAGSARGSSRSTRSTAAALKDSEWPPLSPPSRPPPVRPPSASEPVSSAAADAGVSSVATAAVAAGKPARPPSTGVRRLLEAASSGKLSRPPPPASDPPAAAQLLLRSPPAAGTVAVGSCQPSSPSAVMEVSSAAVDSPLGGAPSSAAGPPAAAASSPAAPSESSSVLAAASEAVRARGSPGSGSSPPAKAPRTGCLSPPPGPPSSTSLPPPSPTSGDFPQFRGSDRMSVGESLESVASLLPDCVGRALVLKDRRGRRLLQVDTLRRVVAAFPWLELRQVLPLARGDGFLLRGRVAMLRRLAEEMPRAPSLRDLALELPRARSCRLEVTLRGVSTAFDVELLLSELQGQFGPAVAHVRRLHVLVGGVPDRSRPLPVVVVTVLDRPTAEALEGGGFRLLGLLRVSAGRSRSARVLPQCARCLRWGHVASRCWRLEVCLRCGVAGHRRDTCVEEAPSSCFVCGGSHHATYRGCAAHSEARRSYAAAVAASRGRPAGGNLAGAQAGAGAAVRSAGGARSDVDAALSTAASPSSRRRRRRRRRRSRPQSSESAPAEVASGSSSLVGHVAFGNRRLPVPAPFLDLVGSLRPLVVALHGLLERLESASVSGLAPRAAGAVTRVTSTSTSRTVGTQTSLHCHMCGCS